jgi:hypothetical protein
LCHCRSPSIPKSLGTKRACRRDITAPYNFFYNPSG